MNVLMELCDDSGKVNHQSFVFSSKQLGNKTIMSSSLSLFCCINPSTCIRKLWVQGNGTAISVVSSDLLVALVETAEIICDPNRAQSAFIHHILQSGFYVSLCVLHHLVLGVYIHKGWHFN